MSITSSVQGVSPSEAIIETIANRKGVEPMDLDVPLFEAVDPEALDMLVESASDTGGQSSLQITFTYDGYDVRVTSDGRVRVTKAGLSLAY